MDRARKKIQRGDKVGELFRHMEQLTYDELMEVAFIIYHTTNGDQTVQEFATSLSSAAISYLVEDFEKAQKDG